MIGALLLLSLPACVTSDYDDRPIETVLTDTETEPADTTPSGGSAIVGSWVSAGDDIAPLLAAAPGYIIRVDATFGADGSYSATSKSSENPDFDFVGTYTVDDSSDPSAITIDQTSPYPASVEGIWAVAGGVLTYDIVDLSLGSPSTPAGGFGSSTAGDGNVQTYRRAN